MAKEDDQEKNLPQEPESVSKPDETEKPAASGTTRPGGLRLSLSKQEPETTSPTTDDEPTEGSESDAPAETGNEGLSFPPLAGNLAPGAEKFPTTAPHPAGLPPTTPATGENTPKPPPPEAAARPVPPTPAARPPAPGAPKPPPAAGPRPPAGPPAAMRPAAAARPGTQPAAATPATPAPAPQTGTPGTVSAGGLIIDLLSAAAAIAFAVLLYLKL